VLRLSKVYIEENFFPLEVYNKIVQQMISVEYIPPTVDKIKGSYWHTHILPNHCDVQNQIKKLIQQKFNFNVSSFTFQESKGVTMGFFHYKTRPFFP